MNQTDNQTTKNLSHQARIYTLSSVVVLFVVMFIICILIMLTDEYIKKVATARQELVSLKQMSQSSRSLQNFAQSNQDNLLQIHSLFPDEDDFVYVLQDIEKTVKTVDTNGTVKLGASKPTPSQNQNTIPINVVLNTSYANVLTFLRQFERLPYILEITNLELRSPQTLNDTVELIMTVILYVANNFET
jgi:hypothetical protein